MSQINDQPTTEQYILVALIDIYRGLKPHLPEFDRTVENTVIRDVLSAAISFARDDGARQAVSQELFQCAQ